MREEEKILRNMTILADAAFETSREMLEELKASTAADVSFHEIVLEEILASLQQRGISEEEKNRLRGEMEEVKANICNMKTEVKNKANDVKQKKLAFTAANKKFKEFRMNKKKADRPVRAEVENIMEKFCISAAAYHGGDLNGVCARRLMAHSEAIFSNIQP
jgi:hypothetical protein